MSLYKLLVRPVLFRLDAERAHELTLSALSHGAHRVLRLGGSVGTDPRLATEAFGLRFANPLGLAAGLDKQGTAVSAWGTLGFGFAEVGTVTPRPQPGNPRPRLFRLVPDEAIVNRFGFNSDGAGQVAQHLSAHRDPALRVGVNIGKNKDTPNEQAADDYVRCVEALHQHADYFVVNVSSPNTAGLRDLQQAHALRALLNAVTARAAGTPVLVKVSPDMTEDELLAAVDAAVEGGAAGIVATNTTVRRIGLRDARNAAETGGLSGKPLQPLAHATCRVLFRHLAGRVPIIGVGGITSAGDAYQRIRAGAALVQIYTSLVYNGPHIVRQIVSGLSECLDRDGFATIRDAIGVDAR